MEVTRRYDDLQEKCAVGSVPTIIYIPDLISRQEHDQLLHHIYQAPASKWKSLKNRRLQNWGGVVHEKGLLPQDWYIYVIMCIEDKRSLNLSLAVPHWLSRITQKICAESRLFPSEINHVLINEYLPDQGIMPHQDGPAYYPVVAILSLGSPVVMDFSSHHSLRSGIVSSRNNLDEKNCDQGAMDVDTSKLSDNRQTFSVILMPCSLLIFKDKVYSDYLHGIKDCERHQFDEAVNLEKVMISPGPFPLDFLESVDISSRESNVFHRTGTRVSLTCRVVTKVHRKLFRM